MSPSFLRLLFCSLGLASSLGSTGQPAAADSSKPPGTEIHVVQIDDRTRPSWAPRFRAPSQPNWGLALSGGAAWGLAHIAILQQLEDEGLEPGIVAGTSAGAIIGALWATDHDPDLIEQIFRQTDWNRALAQGSKRRTLTHTLDPLLAAEALGRMGRTRDGERLPLTGLVPDDVLRNLLVRYLGRDACEAESDLDRLSRRLRIVSTDLRSGTSYAPQHGSLIQLIRASAGLPVFAPVSVGDRVLIDGGVTENIPVPTVVDNGANVVIAVSLEQSGDRAAEIASASRIDDLLRRSYDVALAAQRRQTLELADATIPVLVGDASLGDFVNTLDPLLTAGRQAWLGARAEVIDQLERGAGEQEIVASHIDLGTALPSAELARLRTRLGLDGSFPARFTRLQLEAELARLLNSGHLFAGHWHLDGDQLQLIAEPCVGLARVTVTGAESWNGQRYFDDHAEEFGSCPARVFPRLRRFLVSMRHQGAFLAGVQSSSFDPDTGELTIAIAPGVADSFKVLTTGGNPWPTPRLLEELEGRTGSIDSIERALSAWHRLGHVVRPRLSGVRKLARGRFEVQVLVDEPPAWELTWTAGVGDTLGPSGWVKLAWPQPHRGRVLQSRLVAAREGIVVGTELGVSQRRRWSSTWRSIGGRLFQPQYDASGSLDGTKGFWWAGAAGGLEGLLSPNIRAHAALTARWTSADGFALTEPGLPAASARSGASLGLEWGLSGSVQRVQGPANQTRLSWSVEGFAPVADLSGPDQGWSGQADVELLTPIGRARLWTVELAGRWAEAGDEPIPLDRWSEAGAWWQAPTLSPGRGRARDVRRGTLALRRDLGAISGVALEAGVTAGLWHLGDRRVDPNLPTRGRGASLLIQAATPRLGPFAVGLAFGGLEGDRVFFTIAPARLAWPRSGTRMPGTPR